MRASLLSLLLGIGRDSGWRGVCGGAGPEDSGSVSGVHAMARTQFGLWPLGRFLSIFDVPNILLDRRPVDILMRHYFIGQCIGNVEVLELLPGGGPYGGMYYRVRCLCCGEESVMRHSSISDREKVGSKTCKECSPSKRIPRSPNEIHGAMDLKGFLWPTLGKLGMRSAAVDQTGMERRARKERDRVAERNRAERR